MAGRRLFQAGGSAVRVGARSAQLDPEQLLQPLELASASRCSTAVMPQPRRPSQFSRRSSTNTQSRGIEPDPLGAQPEDLGLRLVQPHLAGDHDAVEQLRESCRGRSGRVPRSWRSGRSSGRRRARGAALRSSPLGLHPREQPVDETLVAVLPQAEDRAEQRRELSSVSSPASSRRSSAIASGRSRNARDLPRSMPSASQNARNESHTLVVSTPP